MTTTNVITRSPVDTLERHTIAGALLTTWLVTAVWDFCCATALSVFAYGGSFARLWQGVGATAFGSTVAPAGIQGILAGVAAHLMVAFAWSAIFIAALALSPALRRMIVRPAGALAVAAVYAPIIWLTMSLLVIPLATGRPPSIGFRWWVQVFAHLPFVTLPLVFTARRRTGPHHSQRLLLREQE